jgi:hypothetical protein
VISKLKLQAWTLLKRGRNRYFEHERKLYGLNEAVNFEKQAIFIAVPKTGTTAIRNQIRETRQFWLPYPHLNIREIRMGLDFYFLSQSLGRNRAFPTDTTSVRSTDVILGDAEAFYLKAFKFGSVRNPWARTVSLYFRREGIQNSDNISFSEFCDKLSYASDTCTKPTLHRNQVDWLTDNNGKISLDFVMKLEERDDAINRIKEMTNGRVSLHNIRANENPASTAKSYRDLYDDRSRQTVAKLFEKDIDILKYSF